ncbi:MAG: alpha/beta fold hydrolase [Bdellovibrionales bacterium]|nr:alpha/beta fold hydrolase [Bdellovibrionales bacterium]
MIEINYQIENPEDKNKPWLVLINGLFADLHSWDQAVPQLVRNFRVLRYDGRGQGQSFRPSGPYYLKDHVSDLKGLLDRLEIHRCMFLGISNGGRVAMQFSQIYPEYVIAQVLADTYSEISNSLYAKLNSWLQAHKLGGGALRFVVAAPWIWSKKSMDENNSKFEFYQNKAADENPQVIESLILGAMKDDVEINSQEIPTLVLSGEEDILVSEQEQISLKNKFKISQFQKIPGGHASLIEYPQSIQDYAVPFLEEYL